MAAANFDTNLYGSHPVYLSLSSEGKAHGAFLRNSNGMDVVYGADADSLTFNVIGGVVALLVFVVAHAFQLGMVVCVWDSETPEGPVHGAAHGRLCYACAEDYVRHAAEGGLEQRLERRAAHVLGERGAADFGG